MPSTLGQRLQLKHKAPSLWYTWFVHDRNPEEPNVPAYTPEDGIVVPHQARSIKPNCHQFAEDSKHIAMVRMGEEEQAPEVQGLLVAVVM